MDLYTPLGLETHHKLVQLTPELLKILESPEIPLYFKAAGEAAPNDEVVLCTDNKTFQLKQKDHSNTVLILRKRDAQLGTFEAIASTGYEYEVISSNGHINLDAVPMITDMSAVMNAAEAPNPGPATFEAVAAESACSYQEALAQWRRASGVELPEHGGTYILGRSLVDPWLRVLLASIMEFAPINGHECKRAVQWQKLLTSMRDGSEMFHDAVAMSVLWRFGACSGDEYVLNMREVVVWQGLNALRSFPHAAEVSTDELLIRWQAQFPPYFECELNTVMLQGWICHTRVSETHAARTHLRLVDPTTLPSTSNRTSAGALRDRLAYLFKLQRCWFISDLEPYVEDLNTRKAKTESLLLRHCRILALGKDKIAVTR